MKIALAAIQFKVMGGKERDCLAIARHLAARGHAVRLLTTTRLGSDLPIPTERVPVAAVTNHGRAAAFARALARRAGAFNVVFAFDKLPSADFCYVADVCLRAQNVGPKRFLPRRRTLLALERGVFAPPARAHCFFLTESQRADYAGAYGTPSERSTVLPLLLHADRRPPGRFYADRDRTRRQLGIPEAVPLAIALAATNPARKGLDRSIAALADIPDLRLLTVGGALGRRFMRQAVRLGVAGRVHALPYKPEVAPLLAACDLMIHPARVEAAGMALVEALLAGIPVVTTAACGYAPEVEKSGAGRVVHEPFRHEAFGAAIRQALAQGEALKARARAYARNLVRGPPAWLDVIAERIEGSGGQP